MQSGENRRHRKGENYKIHFIRHGLTQGNADGKYIGHTDESLSQEGVAQIERMKKDYDYPGTPVIFSSPLKSPKMVFILSYTLILIDSVIFILSEIYIKSLIY